MPPASQSDSTSSTLIISDVDDIHALDLSSNRLTQLPQGFGITFSSLRALDISDNRILALPEDIGQLNQLGELYAGHNAIERLPQSLGSLSSLAVLDVRNNRLSRLPPSLGLLAKSLRVLLIDGNPFDSVHRILVEPITATRKRDSVAAKTLVRAPRKDDAARTKDHMAAIKKLVMIRFKRHRHRSTPAPLTTNTGGDSTIEQNGTLESPSTSPGDGSGSSSTSQRSLSTSAGCASESSQSSAAVSRVLWQLRDEWDLDPQHGEAANVSQTLVRGYIGRAGIDGASIIARAYREKASTAGNSQRTKILSELLVTEVTYVDTLKNVVGVYLNPLREQKILPESELREIFSNIEVILSFHNDHFLPAITYAISRPEMAIGSVFLHHSAHFRLYSTYTNNHETSVKTLSSIVSRRAVSDFIREARQDVTQIGQVSLDGHLLTPVQRLPRYRMLLTDLLSNTPSNHPDHEALFMALTELNAIIFDVNEKKRAFENQSQLRRLQRSISGSADIPLLASHRVFCLEGSLCLRSKSKMVVHKSGVLTCKRSDSGSTFRYFLFNDMLLQCVPGVNKDFKVNRVHMLGTRKAPADIILSNELRIVGSDVVLYLNGTPSIISKWAHAFNSRFVFSV